MSKSEMGRKEENQEGRTELSHQCGHFAAVRSQHGITYWDLDEKLQHRRTLELTAAARTRVCTYKRKPSAAGI